MEAELSLIGIVRLVWMAMRNLWFGGINHSWPIRIKLLEPATATFRYPDRQSYVEVKTEFHLRIRPVILKNIRLIIKGEDNQKQAMSFYLRNDYELLRKTCPREEVFKYDDFEEGKKGRLIVDTESGQCWTGWFPIQLTNKKDDLPSLDSIKPRTFKL